VHVSGPEAALTPRAARSYNPPPNFQEAGEQAKGSAMALLVC